MYATVDEVRAMIKEDAIDSLIDDRHIEDENERDVLLRDITLGAIQDADAEINGYLARRYPVPLTTIPQMINKLSKDIALYNLFSRRGIDEQSEEKNYLTRYKAAIDFLKLVAEGKAEIGLDTPKQAAASGFSMKSSEKLFSRKSMKGY